MEKRIVIEPNTDFFNRIFTPLCRQIHYPKKEVNVVVGNKDKYKFVFDYPENNDDVIGTEVYKLIQLPNEKSKKETS